MTDHAWDALGDENPSPQRCRTPGAVYTTTIRPWVMAAYVRVPAGLELFGYLSDEQKQTLIADMHNAILPAVEEVYRKTWTHLAGRLIPDCGDKPMPDRWEDLTAPAEGGE